jgi:hypothetical protein
MNADQRMDGRASVGIGGSAAWVAALAMIAEGCGVFAEGGWVIAAGSAVIAGGAWAVAALF